MRDKSFDSQSFCFDVKKRILKYSEKFLRTSALDNPNFLEKHTGDLTITTRDSTDLVVLALVSWFIDKEIGILLRLKLEQMIGKNEDLNFIRLLLENKGLALCYLCDTQLWHTRDFFGNVLTDARLQRLTKQVKFQRRILKRPSRVQRKRGYKDKGSLKKIHEYHEFASGTLEQNTIEAKRLSQQETILFLQGWSG